MNILMEAVECLTWQRDDILKIPSDIVEHQMVVRKENFLNDSQHTLSTVSYNYAFNKSWEFEKHINPVLLAH